jgi:hypothetical protein
MRWKGEARMVPRPAFDFLDDQLTGLRFLWCEVFDTNANTNIDFSSIRT